MTRPDPIPIPHADHDRLLVAAYVAGDLEATDAARARDLIEACTECTMLAADLRAVTQAVRALPAPARTRDFRVAAEDAMAADRRGLRRFLPAWSPSLAFARPLGAALTTAGVAGLLFAAVLGGSPVMKILSNIGGPVGPAGGAGYSASFSPEQASGHGSQDSSSTGGKAVPSPAASPASAEASDGRNASAPSTPPVPALASPSPVPPDASIPPSSPSPAAQPSPATPPPATPSSASDASGKPATAGSSGVPLLPAASLAAVLVGLGLLGADRLARRR